MGRRYERIRTKHRFYMVGEHEKYVGHVFIFIMDYIEEGKIKTDVIVVNEKDIFHKALDKARYFASKNNA
jgi:hypothetical protein